MVVLLIIFIHFPTHNIRVTQEASQTPLGRRILLTILRLSPSSAASIESQQQRCRGAFQGYREVGCHGRRQFCWLKLVWKWNINPHRKWSVHQWTWELTKIRGKGIWTSKKLRLQAAKQKKWCCAYRFENLFVFVDWGATMDSLTPDSQDHVKPTNSSSNSNSNWLGQSAGKVHEFFDCFRAQFQWLYNPHQHF